MFCIVVAALSALDLQSCGKALYMTLFVPGATAVCSGSAKSMEDCASFEVFCNKGDEHW